jgi:hypothetical protein
MSKLHDLFELHNDEFLKFENIPLHNRLHDRRDLCAFLYLQEKLGGKGTVIGGAEHDEIYLDFDNPEELLTSDDVRYVTRCGVRWDEDACSLCMFA